MTTVLTDPYFRLEIYSHFFKVSQCTPRMQGLMLRFFSKYTHNSFTHNSYKLSQQGAAAPEPKIFAIKTKNDKEYRFHIGQLQEFYKYLEDTFIDPSFYETRDYELYKAKPIKLNLKPNYVLRAYQEEAKTFVLNEEVTDFHTRLVTIATGLGKGVISLACVAALQNKFLVVVLAKFAEKWAIEVAEKTDIPSKEIMIIQGSGQLKGIIQAAQENPDAVKKCTIISLTTLQNFYKTYEENPDGDDIKHYGIKPEELCSTLGVGSVIIDEVHEHLHGVYKFMCYTHVPKIITLSGTVISDDAFIERIHKIMFPKEIRFDNIKMNKYIKVYPISYVFKDFLSSKIRTTEFGSRSYSQVAFEQSLIKQKHIFNNYLLMIYKLIELGYLSNYQKGDKLAIYAGRSSMCTEITEYLKRRLPHMDVRRYVEEDPYENVIEADIRVTTIISAGTAIDIPGLVTVIMTNCVNSPVANLQTLGRLREIKDREVRFFYLYCEQIEKQVNYHLNRMELYADRVASIKVFKSPIAI